ncbi:MAG TPA: PAS domain S-box protein, partial [Ktedonobacterales bacterium]|nr:PAS domain S-box protein [Ktedonobacterales bacterium]
REEARTRAERQAEQLDRIFEQMADGVVVFDAQGRILRENQAQRRLTGEDAAPPDYALMPLTERMALFAARDEQGRPLMPDEGPLARVLAGDVVAGAEAMDIQSRTLDGREVFLNISAAPLRDRSGRLVGAIGVFRDQTERKRLERAVSEQAHQLEATFAAITDAIVLYDGQGTIQLLNPAAHDLLIAPLPPDYRNRPVQERVESVIICDARGVPLPKEEHPVMRLLRGQVLSGAQTQEIVLRLPDGRQVEVSVGGAPIRDAKGSIVGAVTVVRDETARKRLERERQEARTNELALREVNWRMDAFLAIASHDVRAPVTVTMGTVAIAQRLVERLV